MCYVEENKRKCNGDRERVGLAGMKRVKEGFDDYNKYLQLLDETAAML